MTTFDTLFFSFFNQIKKRYKQRSNTISVAYISLVQCSLILLLGVFFSEFLAQMKVNTMSSSKAWTLFILVSIALYFRNWMYYSGKKRKILNTKTKSNNPQYSIVSLILLPIVTIAIAILFLVKIS
jgi:protein-S-isoprenylcysteine O-methyltransferase Ste14